MELRGRREKGVEGHMVKQMNLVSTNVMEEFIQIAPNCSRASLQAVIKEKVNKDSVIHSYQWR